MITKVIVIVAVMVCVVSINLIRSYEKSMQLLNEEVEMAYGLLAISEEDIKIAEKKLKEYYGEMIESLIDENVALMKKLNKKNSGRWN